MSKINVDTWEPESGTAATMMASGDTVTLPSGATLAIASGATLANSGTVTGIGGGFHKVTVFTTSSSAGGYSPDTGVTKIIVEVQGAGGSSGNSTASNGSSGSGAGGYAMKSLTVADTDTMTVTIGAVTATAAGGDTKFTSVTGTSFTEVKGTGGGAGTVSSGIVNGGDGGVGSGGDLNIDGHPGAPKNANDSNMVGASSMFGSGGVTRADSSETGRHASGYGAGGSGGNANTSLGGQGTAGLVIVWEYK